MATNKSTNKVSKKAEADLNIKKPTKKTTKKAKKQIKKLSVGTICIALLLLAVGVVGGFFGFNYLSRNDCFVIIGQDELSISLNEVYVDEGVKIIAFGFDDSSKAKVETNMQEVEGGYTATEEGTYYIKYTVSNIKYGSIFKIQKIRLIHVVEPTETEEIGG